MICILQKTLKASPLSNRGCAVPPDYPTTGKMHPKGMPHQESGHNGQGQNGHFRFWIRSFGSLYININIYI